MGRHPQLCEPAHLQNTWRRPPLLTLKSLNPEPFHLRVQEITASDFEKHGGLGTAKKWKYTVRIMDECLQDNRLGIWLVKHGLLPEKEPRCVLASTSPGSIGAGPQ